MMIVTSQAIEEYMIDSNASIRIAEQEAKQRGVMLIEREIIMELSDEAIAGGDPYAYMGGFSLKVEEVFTNIFSYHQIDYFSGYKVTEIKDDFGRKFKVSTVAVRSKH